MSRRANRNKSTHKSAKLRSFGALNSPHFSKKIRSLKWSPSGANTHNNTNDAKGETTHEHA